MSKHGSSVPQLVYTGRMQPTNKCTLWKCFAQPKQALRALTASPLQSGPGAVQ
jgi:hypothetical protein